MRPLVTLAFSMSVAGCAYVPHIPPITKQVSSNQLRERPILRHEVTLNEVLPDGSAGGVDAPTYFSCAVPRNPSALGDPKIASLAAPFAMMASNSYRTKAFFEIPGWRLSRHLRGGFRPEEVVGFQADVYEEVATETGCAQCRAAIVFRGTDTIVDRAANFALAWPDQYSRVPAQHQLADHLTSQYVGRPLVLVGHSLGGALAIHASWNRANSVAFAFNSSPRKWQPDRAGSDTKRYDIAESGEVLRLVGWLSDLEATEHRFNFGERGLVEDHDMYHFARSLLFLARAVNDPFAVAAASTNLGCEAPAQR